MNNTKNDLCADLAKLDFEAMVFTANIAVGLLIESISGTISALRNARADNNIRLYLEADDLKRDATALSICAATLTTLKEARTRERLEVVNKSSFKS
jgi:hypothetical protein